jgi:hypothetical protein
VNGNIILLPIYVIKARRGTVLPLRCNTESSDSRLTLLVRCSLHSSGDFLEKKCVDIRRPLTLWLLQGLNVVESLAFVFDL